MIKITDPQLINEIVMHPDIAPGFFAEQDKPCGLPDSLICLQCDSGLFVLEHHEAAPGHYEAFAGIHAAIIPEKRGKKAVIDAKKAIKWAFDNLNIEKVLARIENTRKEVKLFASLSGMCQYNKDATHTYYEVLPCH